LFTSGSDGSFFMHNKITKLSPYEPILSSYEYDYLVSDHCEIPKKQEKISAREGTTWLQTIKIKQGEDKKMESKDLRDVIRSKIGNVSQKIQAMIQANDERDEREQLDQKEFFIDVIGKQNYQKEINKEAEEMKNKIRSKNEENDMVSARLRQMHWDTMETHACDIRTVLPHQNSTVSVSNFPLRKIPKKEERELQIIKRLRRCEINEIQRNRNKASRRGLCWSSFLDETPSETPEGSFLVDPTICKSTQLSDSRAALSDKKENDVFTFTDNDDVFDSFVEVSDDLPTHMMLYPPLYIRTDGQRRMQIILLKEHAREVAKDFNNRFQAALLEKENTLGLIEGINERIQEILVELNCNDEIFSPSLHDTEIPDSILHVKETEIESAKCESAAERLEREKLEEEQASKQAQSDDAPERALMEMMNGTLEVKKQIAQEPLQRPSWMDEISPEEMSEDQQKEVATYEEKEKERVQALEEHRQALTLELKKLRSEINDIASAFDKSVVSLQSDRFQVRNVIAQNELYQTRLANSIFRNYDNIKATIVLEEEIESKRKELTGLSASSARLQKELDKLKDDLNIKIENDKAMERSFRKSIQKVATDPLDQETVKLLLELFRSRGDTNAQNQRHQRSGSTKMNRDASSSKNGSIRRRSLIGRQSGRERSTWGSSKGGSDGASRKSIASRGSTDTPGGVFECIRGAMIEANEFYEDFFVSEKDPFHIDNENTSSTVRGDDDSNEGSESIPMISMDCIPEGFFIAENVWNSMQELRIEKIKSETVVMKISNAVQNMKALCDQAQYAEESILSSISRLEKKVEDMKAKRQQLLKNPEFLVHVKQGQDEIEKELVATDYSNAVFVPIDIIEKTNSEIRSLGDERETVLNKTKDFRKIINFMKWNHELLELQENDAKEQYKDWQLLRVTNQLKLVLDGTKVETERLKLKKAEEQIVKQQKIYDEKDTKHQRENKQILRTIKRRAEENKRLRQQLEGLKQSVAVKEEIHNGILKGGSKQDQTERKMKHILRRRALADKVKAQEEQILTLKSEVVRMQERTFPSFSPHMGINDVRNRHYNPDER